MANKRSPIVKYLSLGAGASGTFTFPSQCGRVDIKNLGAGDIYVAFDAAPASTQGNGQFTLAGAQRETYSRDDIYFVSVGVYAVAAAKIECIGYLSSGSGLQ